MRRAPLYLMAFRCWIYCIGLCKHNSELVYCSHHPSNVYTQHLFSSCCYSFAVFELWRTTNLSLRLIFYSQAAYLPFQILNRKMICDLVTRGSSRLVLIRHILSPVDLPRMEAFFIRVLDVIVTSHSIQEPYAKLFAPCSILFYG